jgi:predicted nucleic acid-binding protein
MAWVVDTCLVIDILEEDAEFGRSSALLLDHLAAKELVLCPISYVELAPAFLGDFTRQNDFLNNVGIHYSIPWAWHDTQNAHKAWTRYVNLRRERKTNRRPVADILIGAFAASRQGLLTRNPDDFAPVFPSLEIRVPE